MKRRNNSTLDSPNGFMTALFGACPGLLSIGWDSPSSLSVSAAKLRQSGFRLTPTSKIPCWSANHPLELDWHHFTFQLTMSAIPVLRNNTHSVAVGYFCWIFGFFGAHRFYYGKKITGTIWFFTLGLLHRLDH